MFSISSVTFFILFSYSARVVLASFFADVSAFLKSSSFPSMDLFSLTKAVTNCVCVCVCVCAALDGVCVCVCVCVCAALDGV